MKMPECKQMLISIMENKAFKASEVSELLASLHTLICEANSNSLILTFKSIANDDKLKSPITKMDFTSFVEDVLMALEKEGKVNLTKYNYIPWLYYIKTGLSGSTESYSLNGSVINLPSNDMRLRSPEVEISTLLANTNLKNTILVYGVLLLILGK